MTAQFRCYACGAVRSANEKLIGHRMRCPDCDTMVELPMLADNDGIFQGAASREDAQANADEAAMANAAELAPLPSPADSAPGLTPLAPTTAPSDLMATQEFGPSAAGLTPMAAGASGNASESVPPAAGNPHAAQPATATAFTPVPAAPRSLEDELAEEEARQADADYESPPSNAVEAEMDMTPMVDVTFLLLIFFMVTASFSVQQALPVPNPQDDAPSTQTVEQDPEEDHESVTVEVDEFNTYQVLTTEWEEEAPSVQELHARLQESREGVEGAVPSKLIVKAHTEAIHDRVVAALDAGQKAGFEEIQLMTIDTEE